MRNSRDSSSLTPRLRLGLHLGTVGSLPPQVPFSKLTGQVRREAIRAAGFDLLQGVGGDEDGMGFEVAGQGSVRRPEDADAVARGFRESGAPCGTLHVGGGFEDEDEAEALLVAVLRASEEHEVPMYVETHRATITQDPWRTLQFVERHPELRFNGDFSHWYTGVEMTYGDINAKFDTLQPVFDRVRFLHGRIGSSGSIQVNILRQPDADFIGHFREMWTRSFTGFLKDAEPGDYIAFLPELLHPEINYAPLVPDAEGRLVEDGDRWEQAQAVARIATEAFAEALARTATV